MFKNVYLLYFIFLISIINITWFIYHKNYDNIIIFITIGLLIYLINKNMIFVLGISIIITNILYIKKEGLELGKNLDNSYNEMIDNSYNEMIDNSYNEMIDNSYNEMIDNSYNEMIDNSFMQGKSAINKLNPNIVESIKNMNEKSIQELNNKINQLNNIKDA